MSDDVWPFAIALREVNRRDTCFCGEPLGHMGWIACVSKRGDEIRSGS